MEKSTINPSRKANETKSLKVPRYPYEACGFCTKQVLIEDKYNVNTAMLRQLGRKKEKGKGKKKKRMKHKLLAVQWSLTRMAYFSSKFCTPR